MMMTTMATKKQSEGKKKIRRRTNRALVLQAKQNRFQSTSWLDYLSLAQVQLVCDAMLERHSFESIHLIEFFFLSLKRIFHCRPRAKKENDDLVPGTRGPANGLLWTSDVVDRRTFFVCWVRYDAGTEWCGPGSGTEGESRHISFHLSSKMTVLDLIEKGLWKKRSWSPRFSLFLDHYCHRTSFLFFTDEKFYKFSHIKCILETRICYVFRRSI